MFREQAKCTLGKCAMSARMLKLSENHSIPKMAKKVDFPIPCGPFRTRMESNFFPGSKIRATAATNVLRRVKDTLTNIALIIKYDSNLQNIVYNEFKDTIDVIGELPWTQVKPGWNDSDLANAKVYFERVYGIWSPTKFKDALLAVVSSDRVYHPIKKYFCQSPSGSENSSAAVFCLSSARTALTFSSCEAKSCIALKEGSFPISVPSSALASRLPNLWSLTTSNAFMRLLQHGSVKYFHAIKTGGMCHHGP